MAAPADRRSDTSALPVGLVPEAEAARAESARNLTAGLGGTAVALLTFTLFFLYPQYKSGNIDSNLFQGTVVAITLSVFFLAYSSVFYGRLVGSLLLRKGTWRSHASTAGLFQLVGLAFLALQPALVLFTIRLPLPAGVALVAWILFLISVYFGRHDFYPPMVGQ